MSGDFYKEWRAKAEIDYFPQLIILWLSTNSWYRSHYSDITSNKDRDFLNKLRDDHTKRNKMFNRFDTLLQSKSKESIELLNHIEGLFFALNRAELLWDDNNPNIKMKISFQSCLTFDSNSSKTYIDLTTQSNSNIKISDTLKLINNPIDIFKGIIEIVYKIRCHLVHGQLEPNENNHEVVKYCYFLLRVLMLF